MYLKSQNSFLAALYMRLSKDDGDKVESDSIRNQRSLLRDFVKQHSDITLVKEYVDDGFSGTNFERPDFQRMLEDARNHKINCIIVKDLSRLGRNYIETGRYLEKIFPVLGIRFIAVNDHYDSADTTNDSDQIIVPFKNLVNDAYCRDISIKIRSQLDIKRKKGQFIGNYAGYGYFKDPKDKNHLVIDEYAAEIVRMIFNMKIDGYSAKNIAARLNEMGVLIPAEYKRACGFNYSSGFMAGKKPKWDVSSVLRILKNELYTGTMVQGKTRKINYKVNVRQKIEPENWIRVEGTHEPIVSKEIFECVQKLMELDTRTSPEEESIYEFSGLLRCGDCGQNLVRQTAAVEDFLSVR
jgi:site-specific DNA recombinase